MRYLCLIYLDEKQMDAMPARDMSDLNARHLDFNDQLRQQGKFLVAEALEPARATKRIQFRNGKTTVLDGPYTEAKEFVAGFYLIEANDLDEATRIASQIPSAPLGTIEVRPARQLFVEGRPPRWG